MEILNNFLNIFLGDICKMTYFQEYTLFSFSRYLYHSRRTEKCLLMQWETQSSNLGKVHMSKIFSLVAYSLGQTIVRTTKEAETRLRKYDRAQQKKLWSLSKL